MDLFLVSLEKHISCVISIKFSSENIVFESVPKTRKFLFRHYLKTMMSDLYILLVGEQVLLVNYLQNVFLSYFGVFL